MSLISEHGNLCLPCSVDFSILQVVDLFQIDILATEISDFLKQIAILKSFNSVLEDLHVVCALMYSQHETPNFSNKVISSFLNKNSEMFSSLIAD